MSENKNNQITLESFDGFVDHLNKTDPSFRRESKKEDKLLDFGLKVSKFVLSHRLSDKQMAKLTHVPEDTIATVEDGNYVRPSRVIKIDNYINRTKAYEAKHGEPQAVKDYRKDEHKSDLLYDKVLKANTRAEMNKANDRFFAYFNRLPQVKHSAKYNHATDLCTTSFGTSIRAGVENNHGRPTTETYKATQAELKKLNS